MDLIFDRRAEIGDAPGLHAFIVGVSAYRNLPKGTEPGAPKHMGLRQLSCTAISAYKVYCWLLEHQSSFPVQLATVRMLLSPSPEEIARQPELDSLVNGATRENFVAAAQEWQTDAAGRPENMTLFYFAGHGAQRTKDDAVLILEDFGEGGPLEKAVELRNIFQGMAKSDFFPNIAQTQLYFVDACRDFLRPFRRIESPNIADVFMVDLGTEDYRRAPIFFAAVPGTKAYARIGEQTLFSQALMDCLNNDGGEYQELEGEEKWCVSVHSLSKALADRNMEINAVFGVEQEIVPGGLAQEAIIYFLPEPPKVKVVLIVDPPEALPVTRVEVLDDAGAPLPPLPFPLDSNPYLSTLPAGFYTVSAVINPPTLPFVDFRGRSRPVKPPKFQRTMKVTL